MKLYPTINCTVRQCDFFSQQVQQIRLLKYARILACTVNKSTNYTKYEEEDEEETHCFDTHQTDVQPRHHQIIAL